MVVAAAGEGWGGAAGGGEGEEGVGQEEEEEEEGKVGGSHGRRLDGEETGFEEEYGWKHTCMRG